jgi:hypothetical protein
MAAGTATVYMTNEDAALSNRMIEDVLAAPANRRRFQAVYRPRIQRWHPEREPKPFDQL